MPIALKEAGYQLLIKIIHHLEYGND